VTAASRAMRRGRMGSDERCTMEDERDSQQREVGG